MRPLCYYILSLLCSLHGMLETTGATGNSKQCNDTQYSWPLNPSKFCCDKCPPGQHMVKRQPDKCGIECKPCIGDRFIPTYNVEQSCSVCDSCSKSHMEFRSRCNATHNAVCKCKDGFRCSDKSCTSCELVPTTIKPTLPPATKVSRFATTPKPRPEQIKDSVLPLVMIALLCLGIAIVVVTKIKPFLLWIRFNHGYFLAEKSAEAPCAENVSQPVQEVCGKCDQCIEGCVEV